MIHGTVLINGEPVEAVTLRWVGVEGDPRPWRIEAPGEAHDGWLVAGDDVSNWTADDPDDVIEEVCDCDGFRTEGGGDTCADCPHDVSAHDTTPMEDDDTCKAVVATRLRS